MLRIAAILLPALACTPKPDAATFGAEWLRHLAEGQTQTAYEQLCSDAQGQIASIAKRSTGETPTVFLGRLHGRYGGVDSIEISKTEKDFVDLEVVTSRARLPLRLKRQGSSFCVSLPQP